MTGTAHSKPTRSANAARRTDGGRADVVERVVVVGNGMVGFRFVEELCRLGARGRFEITVIGEEPEAAYDRVNLTKVFFGKLPGELRLASAEWYAERDVTLVSGDPVILIDRDAKTVNTASGREFGYDQLVLATGSRPVLPDIPGASLPGVFVYRTIRDQAAIHAHAAKVKSAAVVGGGLLGLEIAGALHDLGLETHVIERGSGLLARQLTPPSSSLLQRSIEKAGLVVHNSRQSESVEAVEGGLKLNFRNGTSVEVGMIIFAVGITPRDELARGCGLEVDARGGIRINDKLETSDRSVRAIGECAVHRGTNYGLVLPGYEMAERLAGRLAGQRRIFTGADQSAILKLPGVDVAAVGEFDADGYTYVYETETEYRRIVLVKGRIVGATAVGTWPEQAAIREGIAKGVRVWPWQLQRFRRSGRLWGEKAAGDVRFWPATAEVCNCMRVNCGALRAACAAGCKTVEDLAKQTGASTVCGSCRPLLGDFVGERAAPPLMKGRRLLLAASILAGVVGMLILFLRPIPFANTVQGGWKVDVIWRDPFLKQVTGYTMLGVMVLSLVISLRKRIKFIKWGNFGWWRMVHGVLGSLAVVAMVTHTGFRLGSNLNFILMMNFLALVVLGGIAGGLAALEARLDGPDARRWRTVSTWVHQILFWPLPTLLFFHILKVYYY